MFARETRYDTLMIEPESVIGAAESVAVVDAEKVAIVDGENVTILDADLERAVLTEAAPLAQIDLLNEDEKNPAELSRPASLRYKHTPFYENRINNSDESKIEEVKKLLMEYKRIIKEI